MPFAHDNDWLIDSILGTLPATRMDVSRIINVSRMTVKRRLQSLHEAKWVHISKWQMTPHGGRYLPVFKAGKGIDAKCTLVPQTSAESATKWRKAAQKDGRWEDRSARVRGRYHADKAKSNPDPLVAALFGMTIKKKETVENANARNAGDNP